MGSPETQPSPLAESVQERGLKAGHARKSLHFPACAREFSTASSLGILVETKACQGIDMVFLDVFFAVASQRHCWKSLKPELFSQEPELLGTLFPEQQSRRDFMPCSLSRR